MIRSAVNSKGGIYADNIPMTLGAQLLKKRDIQNCKGHHYGAGYIRNLNVPNQLNFIEKRRFVMKKIAISIILLVVLSGTGICFADAGIPNLVGTWTVHTEGGVLLKAGAAGAKTHHSGEFSTLDGEAVVTKQQGRVLHGTFKSPRATEKFIAVIAMDNKNFYMADEDGFMEGQISNEDMINVIYRHSTSTDTVAAVGTWTRKK